MASTAAALAEKLVPASVAQSQHEGAKVIQGTPLAQEIRSSVASRISALRAQNPRFQPHLVIVQAGSRPDSVAYIRTKTKACEDVGIKSTHVKLRPLRCWVLHELRQFFELLLDSVSGVLVQLPIGDGDGIGADAERVVIEKIGPEKDVDGIQAGVIKLIEATGVPIAGANAVVLGRSDIVGNPVSAMLRKLDATLKNADIVVAAIGKAQFGLRSFFSPVAYQPLHLIESASKVAGYITPVPGGVGPMTVAMLMVNTLRSAEALWAKARERKVTPLPLDIKEAVPSDIEIAMAQTPKDVAVLAKEIGIQESELESYGKYKAKVELSILDRLAHRKNGKYVVVSGITPTPLGEGKSTTTIGLVQAIGAHLGRPAFACFNLHLTGDIHAVTAANNLLGLLRAFKSAELQLNHTITWNRVLDVNDRFLRKITVGQNPTEQGHARETGFDISVASECMAVLALSNSLADMRERLGRMVVATSKNGDPITADDVGVGGALAVLMKDAIKPNLMQTLEGTPVFVHAGPFANIAHGNSSILADRVALKLAGTEEGDSSEREGYVLTEGGHLNKAYGATQEVMFYAEFEGTKLGYMQVVVATTRALKMHGGAPDVTPGKPLHDTYLKEDLVTEFLPTFLEPFVTDTPAELELVKNEALAFGADAAVVSNHWAKGGAGARDLAEALIQACESSEPDFKFTAGSKCHGCLNSSRSNDASSNVLMKRKDMVTFRTQYSFSHDPKLKGVPTGFTVPIRAVRLSAGAGFLYPLLGDMQTMPGLGYEYQKSQGFWEVGLDEKGQVIGLF
ncbi:unnamed protein product [Rhizoctonia solani]|uniref:Methenyltetrahydrofolate cyclohydrolase n=1 Tax=Rhizoctonia solani TaxID=456999 RepID=A0A8H2XJZ3_9AGAM|nr:unnamed protein product [Rhizoctonia solani]